MSSHHHHEARESWIIGYCFAVNSVIGAGILALPYAYSVSGWALGILAQFFALLLSLCSSYNILSGWSRVEAIVQMRELGHNLKPKTFTEIISSFPDKTNENLLEYKIKPVLAERKFDLYEMTKITLGPFHGKILIFIYNVAVYPILCAYYSIFSTSIASNIPLFGDRCNLYEEKEFFGPCRYSYWGNLIIFVGFMTVLSFFKVREHKHFQIALTFFRIYVIFTMVITCFYGIFSDTQLDNSQRINADPDFFNFNGFRLVFFTTVFASLYENMIPTTTSFVKNKARDMPKLINAAVSTFNSLYILIALSVVFTVKNPQHLATLNWRNYSSGHDESTRPFWTVLVSYSIILLPAFELISSFPIVAFNFSDNLMSIIYGAEHKNEIPQVLYK